MRESAAVFDLEGRELYGHYPAGRTSSWLPDSRDLWDFIWTHRSKVGGVAHTHPWEGAAWPSYTDITTFKSIETGLGKMLLWPVITMTDIKFFVLNKITLDYV